MRSSSSVVLITFYFSTVNSQIIIKNLKAWIPFGYEVLNLPSIYKSTLENFQIRVWAWIKNWKYQQLPLFTMHLPALSRLSLGDTLSKIFISLFFYIILFMKLVLYCLRKVGNCKMTVRSSLLRVFVCPEGRDHFVPWLHAWSSHRRIVLLHNQTPASAQ